MFDTFVVILDDGNVNQLVEIFSSLSTCIMSPDITRIGWCSSNEIINLIIYLAIFISSWKVILRLVLEM